MRAKIYSQSPPAGPLLHLARFTCFVVMTVYSLMCACVPACMCICMCLHSKNFPFSWLYQSHLCFIACTCKPYTSAPRKICILATISLLPLGFIYLTAYQILTEHLNLNMSLKFTIFLIPQRFFLNFSMLEVSFPLFL